MSASQKLLDTLDMSSRERARVIAEMNAMAARPSPVPNRRRLRVPYDQAPSIAIRLVDKNSNDTRFTAQPRNISRWGVAAILGRFLYPDSLCLIALPTLAGTYTAHNAMVRQCRHVQGVVHEVSFVLGDPIDLTQYTELSEEELILVQHESKQEQKDDEQRRSA